MSNDLLMLRGEQDGAFNLAVGEPVFLQQRASWCQRRSTFGGDFRYPAFGGNQKLIDLVRRADRMAYHKHVVIATGAKQALLAALHAYRTRSSQPKSVVAMHGPYWPSYPTLVKMSGFAMIDTRDAPVSPVQEGAWDQTVRVITSPNNPDGSESMDTCDIWDAAYASWLYGATATPNAKVVIRSAAKSFGTSGLRVGWLSTDDDEIAQLAREYVEKTTSGVSNEAQARMIDILDMIVSAPNMTNGDFAAARADLLQNGKSFARMLSNHISECAGVPANGVGMFAWFKAPVDRMNAALEKSKVKVIPGFACGLKEENGMGWWRMSMGHDVGYTERAIATLKQALDQ